MKSKKAIAVVVAGAMIAIGGASMANPQAYATNPSVPSVSVQIPAQESSSPSPVEQEKTSTAAALQSAPIYGSISLEEFEAKHEIKIPVNLEHEQQPSKLAADPAEPVSGSNPITHKRFTSIENQAEGDLLQLVYATEDGSEINFFQLENKGYEPAAAVESQKVYFDPSLIKIGEVQGRPALFEDTSSLEDGSKKQIWIAAQDYIYVLHTGSATVDMQALKELAERIDF